MNPMSIRSERDVVLEHALRDEANLDIALKIGAAYDELCRRVVAQFLAAIEHKLSPMLGREWKFTTCRDFHKLAERWVDLVVIEYLSHPGQFRIHVVGDEYLKVVWLGVRATEAPELREKVKLAINRDIANGKIGDPSFWWCDIQKAYSNWQSEEVLLLLYRMDDALEYFVSTLKRLAETIQIALTPAA